MSGDQHIFFCVQKMLETHTDLEQHEGEYITKYNFYGWAIPLISVSKQDRFMFRFKLANWSIFVTYC